MGQEVDAVLVLRTAPHTIPRLLQTDGPPSDLALTEKLKYTLQWYQCWSIMDRAVKSHIVATGEDSGITPDTVERHTEEGHGTTKKNQIAVSNRSEGRHSGEENCHVNKEAIHDPERDSGIHEHNREAETAHENKREGLPVCGDVHISLVPTETVRDSGIGDDVTKENQGTTRSNEEDENQISHPRKHVVNDQSRDSGIQHLRNISEEHIRSSGKEKDTSKQELEFPICGSKNYGDPHDKNRDYVKDVHAQRAVVIDQTATSVNRDSGYFGKSSASHKGKKLGRRSCSIRLKHDARPTRRRRGKRSSSTAKSCADSIEYDSKQNSPKHSDGEYEDVFEEESQKLHEPIGATSSLSSLCQADFPLYLMKLYEDRIIEKEDMSRIRSVNELSMKVSILAEMFEQKGIICTTHNATLKEFKSLSMRPLIDPLRRNLTKLIDDLEAKYITDRLIAAGVISGSAYDSVMSRRTRREQAEELLIYQLPPTQKAYVIFKDSLKENYYHLWELLDECEKKGVPKQDLICQTTAGPDAKDPTTKTYELSVNLDLRGKLDEKTKSTIEHFLAHKLREITKSFDVLGEHSAAVVDVHFACILLHLQVSGEHGVKTLLRDSRNGKLEELFTKLLITDDVKEMAGDNDIIVKVTITDSEFQRISSELGEDSEELDGGPDSNDTVGKPQKFRERHNTFKDFPAVDCFEIVNISHNSISVRFSTSLVDHTAFRVTCIRCDNNRSGITEFVKPNMNSWTFSGLHAGTHRLSVSLLCGDRENAISGPLSTKLAKIHSRSRTMLTRFRSLKSRVRQKSSHKPLPNIARSDDLPDSGVYTDENNEAIGDSNVNISDSKLRVENKTDEMSANAKINTAATTLLPKPRLSRSCSRSKSFRQPRKRSNAVSGKRPVIARRAPNDGVTTVVSNSKPVSNIVEDDSLCSKNDSKITAGAGVSLPSHTNNEDLTNCHMKSAIVIQRQQDTNHKGRDSGIFDEE
uniref:Uncharacterized protein LOC102807547 n=1 Tax=Saccoglossus kowalevskii TaxID=10224 RepID=A0ABM0LX20_SACKO|nr:PREDICTED: uncharacterized protein LOC102807547 [Saccoglossus kowalevskii]